MGGVHSGLPTGTTAIESMRSMLLIDVVRASWERPGFGVVAEEAFFQIGAGRLVEPTSKLDLSPRAFHPPEARSHPTYSRI